ncbi:MAG TPA: DUF2608 domain-containing protein, partial [Rhabdochlamydiaceae bacterium]|nr:DUF2608 domain-containing protein [Rhabdochlamydiaceae bacterium]
TKQIAYFRWLILFLSFCLVTNAFADKNPKTSFKSIESLDEILSVISEKQNNLVIFDIDGTLIVPASALLDLSICPRSFLKQLNCVYEQKETLFEEVFFKALNQCPQKLTEPGLPELVQKIKEKNSKIIALTNRAADITRTVPQLESVGLDFSFSFRRLGHLKLGEKSNQAGASFYEGVIFASGKDKGKILGEFLDKIDYPVQKIIFIDDQIPFLESVDAELKQRGISHACYHYIGWEKNKPKDFDTTLSSFQWLYFLVNEKWIDDDKAKLLFKAQNDNPLESMCQCN